MPHDFEMEQEIAKNASAVEYPDAVYEGDDDPPEQREPRLVGEETS